jgi:hypothetical protein
MTNRWQIANNQSEKARATLVKYHANGDETSPLVDFEMSEITESIGLEQLINSQTSYLDLIQSAANRRRLVITAVCGFYPSWTGNAVISYYLVLILKAIGITATKDQAL